jgi:hypothetical protein
MSHPEFGKEERRQQEKNSPKALPKRGSEKAKPRQREG